jgi:hypothetical protein
MDRGAELVWYVAYGSNLAGDRLRCYLEGGRPHAALRTYAGARDPGEPSQSRTVWLDGGIVFAGESITWKGGMAFYAPTAAGRVAARAYLLTAQQVSDLVCQEIRRPLVDDLGLLADQPHSGRPLGDGAYDVALRLHDIDGHPSVTITSTHLAAPVAPSAAYLWWICRGLREAFGWTPERVAEYLGAFPGVHGCWSARDLIALVDRPLGGPG